METQGFEKPGLARDIHLWAHWFLRKLSGKSSLINISLNGVVHHRTKDGCLKVANIFLLFSFVDRKVSEFVSIIVCTNYKGVTLNTQKRSLQNSRLMPAALGAPMISKKKWEFLPKAENRQTFPVFQIAVSEFRVHNHCLKWMYRAEWERNIKVARIKMESLRSIIFVKVKNASKLRRKGWVLIFEYPVTVLLDC